MKTLLHKTAFLVKPQSQTYICQIDFENKSNGIHYNLFTVSDAPDDEPIRHGIKVIPHTLFNIWLDNKEYLLWILDSVDHNGKHVQRSGEFTYAEYLDSHLAGELIHEYLFDKGFTHFTFDSSMI